MTTRPPPKLDDKQLKTKRRLSTLYALLVLVVIVIAAILMSMKPISSITTERDSVNINVYYFKGNIDTDGVVLSKADERRIKSFNENKICVSVFKTADADEESTKNFLLSWMYVRFPNVNITDDSVVFTEKRWRPSFDACDDAYMSNVFQYEKRMAQTDISMDNVVRNWWRSGLMMFLGAINVIMVLWFISINRNEMAHYKDR